MLKTLPLLFTLLFLYTGIQSQNLVLQAGQQTLEAPTKELDEQFYRYSVHEINPATFRRQLRKGMNDINLLLYLDEETEWNFHLAPSEIEAYTHTISVATDQGIKTLEKQENVHFRGGISDDPDSEVHLTITDDLILGFIRKGDQEYVIEPVRTSIEGAALGQYVFYNVKDIVPGKEHKCAYGEAQEHTDERFQFEEGAQEHLTQQRMSCVEVELAIALDFSMFTKYGSEAAAAAFASGVMGAVQTNYSSDFNVEVTFNIVETFVSNCSSCDPWTTSTNASTILNSFRAWGNGGGFPGVGSSFDLAQFWTNRNLAGSTIGIAWLNAVCTGNRFHVCQDFSTSATLLRVLTAHEIGHNFSARHDASGSRFIMAPSVNSTSTWSTTSKNSINSAIPRYLCLGDCVTAPSADFAADQTFGCAPLRVQYSDLSTNNPTSWNWSFPGGTPRFSNEPNPVVFYDNPGFYSASLEVTNGAGSDAITRAAFIQVKGVPTVAFDYTAFGRTVQFQNFSVDATSYFWEFGDGGTSTDESPSYTYQTDGNFDVRLTAFNECGQNISFFPLFILGVPVAGFDASPRQGCDDIEVTFESQAVGIVEEFVWLFPGGIPDVSNEENPTVLYQSPGTYDVTLIVRNASGEDEVAETSYITVVPSPSAEFNYSIVNETVTFTPQMQDADSYSWRFGDGTTSTDMSPTHTYNGETDFDVELTVSNVCGDAVNTRTISTFPNITFVGSEMVTREDDTDGAIDCRGFVDVALTLQTSKPLSGGDAIVILSLDGEASNFADYEVITDPIIFPANSTSVQNVIVRVFDDQALEALESARFKISLLNGTSDAVIGDNDEFNLNIEDNESTFRIEQQFTAFGLPGRWSRSQLSGSSGWEFGRAADLSSQSLLIPGDPNERIAGVNANRCNCDSGADILISSLFNISDMVHAELVFDVFLPGTNGSTGTVRAVTSTGTTFDIFEVTPKPGEWQRNVVVDLDRFVGQNNMRLVFRHDDNSNRGDGFFIDNVRVVGQLGTPVVANLVNATTDIYLGPFASVFFKDDNSDHIVAKIENRTAWDYGCTQVTIDRAGSGAAAFTDDNPQNFVTEKTIVVNPTNNNVHGDYIMTLYYRNSELSGWEGATLNDRADLQLVKSEGPIQNVTPADPNANGENTTTATSQALYVGNNLKLIGNFTGLFGGYTAGNGFGLTPLPVELLYFSGKVIDESLNVLEWATASEENTSHFLVERSADGQSFETIGRTEAAVNSAVTKSYLLRDESPLKGVNYYRLRQVDQDGQFAYSQIIRLTNKAAEGISFFPNPTSSELNMALEGVQERELLVSIYSAEGKLLRQQSFEVNRDVERLQLQLGDLAEGVYFVKVEGELGTNAYERILKR
ncbi:MAG: PKD domain-containing protein [Bacteroidota bacterium]